MHGDQIHQRLALEGADVVEDLLPARRRGEGGRPHAVGVAFGPGVAVALLLGAELVVEPHAGAALSAVGGEALVDAVGAIARPAEAEVAPLPAAGPFRDARPVVAPVAERRGGIEVNEAALPRALVPVGHAQRPGARGAEHGVPAIARRPVDALVLAGPATAPGAPSLPRIEGSEGRRDLVHRAQLHPFEVGSGFPEVTPPTPTRHRTAPLPPRPCQIEAGILAGTPASPPGVFAMTLVCRARVSGLPFRSPCLDSGLPCLSPWSARGLRVVCE